MEATTQEYSITCLGAAAVLVATGLVVAVDGGFTGATGRTDAVIFAGATGLGGGAALARGLGFCDVSGIRSWSLDGMSSCKQAAKSYKKPSSENLNRNTQSKRIFNVSTQSQQRIYIHFFILAYILIFSVLSSVRIQHDVSTG